MTLSQQVVKFTQSKNKWTDEALSEAIYLTYIGSDDYLKYAKNNPNPSDDQKQDFVDQVITSIEAAIKVTKMLQQLHHDVSDEQSRSMFDVFRRFTRREGGNSPSRAWRH